MGKSLAAQRAEVEKKTARAEKEIYQLQNKQKILLNRLRKEERNAPGRAHSTGTVHKCALVPSDLLRTPAVQHFLFQFQRPRQMGKGNQERFD